MSAPPFQARWVGRSRAAGEGIRTLLAPSAAAAPLSAAQVAARLAAEQAEGLTLVDPPPGFAEHLATLTTVPIAITGQADLGAGGPMSLCPDPEPWIVGPGPGVVRAVDASEDGAVDEDTDARLRHLDLLLTGRGKALTDRAPINHPATSVCLRACRRINRHVLRFLVHQGGVDRRTVLRDGIRMRGRIWDQALKGGFQLRFGRATTRLWSRWTEVPLRNTSNARARRRALRNWLPTDADCGDWIVFARVYQHRHRVGWTSESTDLLGTRCLQISPLASLAALVRPPGRHELDAHLGKLLLPHAVRIIECCDRWLVERLVNALGGLSAPQRVEPDAIDGGAHTLMAWYDLLDRHGRLDLAAGPMRATAQWLAGLDLDRLRQQVTASTRRVPLRAALAHLIEATLRPVALHEAMRACRYGDPRYAEAQIFLADFEAHLAAATPTLTHLARRLRGVIG